MDDAISRPGALTRRSVLAAGAAGALLPGAVRAGGTMNPRLSIADPHEFIVQPAARIQHRFDLYKRIGVGTLRMSIGWWDQEVADGSWQGASHIRYLKQAARNGFRFKMQVGTISTPPAWFVAKHPEAQLLNHDRTASRSDLSYWYPDLRSVMAAKADTLFGYLAEQKLFEAIDYIFVDCGPAAEPIYPANWTLGPEFAGRDTSFWFYDPNAQTDFAPKMRAAYGGLLSDANRAWGTSFARWGDVKIPDVGRQPGAMWNDVLVWYRNAKRDFVAWQIANYQVQLRRHASGHSPKLVLMIPGSHIPTTAWQKAIREGGGDVAIKVMGDSEYLIEVAAKNGCWLQYTGVENEAEVTYLVGYINANGLQAPMWGENAGLPRVAENPQEIADVANKHDLFGLEYVNSSYIFDETGMKPNRTFQRLAQAFSSTAVKHLYQ